MFKFLRPWPRVFGDTQWKSVSRNSRQEFPGRVVWPELPAPRIYKVSKGLRTTGLSSLLTYYHLSVSFLIVIIYSVLIHLMIGTLSCVVHAYLVVQLLLSLRPSRPKAWCRMAPPKPDSCPELWPQTKGWGDPHCLNWMLPRWYVFEMPGISPLY